MRRSIVAFYLLLLLPLAGVLAPVGGARADECRTGCGREQAACFGDGRMSKLACTRDCRLNAAPEELGACIHGCIDTFRGAKDACRAGHGSCRESCELADDADGVIGQCIAACAHELGDCARARTAAGRECRRSCHSAPDLPTCLRECAAARDKSCAEDFAACRTGCGVTTTTVEPTTTTSTTLPPPPPACNETAAPTCSGTCPLIEQGCVPVSSTECACVVSSPTGAFVDGAEGSHQKGQASARPGR